MKHAAWKDVLVALLPTAVFFAYRGVEMPLTQYAMKHFKIGLWYAFNVVAPLLVGAALFFVASYAWRNRRTLVFISLFCGSFLMSLTYVFLIVGVFGIRASRMVLEGSGAPMAYVAVGIYIVGFWVSLVCFIRYKMGLGQPAAAPPAQGRMPMQQPWSQPVPPESDIPAPSR